MRRVDERLSREEQGAEALASLVAALEFPPVTLAALRRISRERLTIGTVRRLTAHAHELIARSPRKSMALALLAIRVAETIRVPDERLVEQHVAEGEAWMRYAAALFELGQFHDARDAAAKADAFFTLSSPQSLRSAVTLELIVGKILHFLDHTDEGLRLIDRSAKILLNIFEEPAKYVEAMTIYAAILMWAGRYDEAGQTWQDIAVLAREQGDRATLAYVVNNVGRCHLHDGDIENAERCFRTALQMFTELKLSTEIPRVRLNLALILRETGRYDTCVREMYASRREFLGFAMLFDAADVAMQIIETSFIAGRVSEILRLAVEAERFFRSARMPQEARKAATYVREAARAGTLAIENVHDVQSFLRRLRDDSTALFEPPR